MWLCYTNIVVLSYLVSFAASRQSHLEDNEFAEFEDADDDWSSSPTDAPSPSVETVEEVDEIDDIQVETEDEFEHFRDEEEFEGIDIPSYEDAKSEPKIKFANVPVHRAANWDRFYVEMLMILAIGVYFVNFLSGKTRNQKLANMWLTAHRPILEANFSLVGDDGKVEPGSAALLKESENVYTLWCSGRVCCEGMLVQLKFLKRQDLVSVMSNMLKGVSSDQVELRVTLNPDEMDTFVLCLANKKAANKLAKDMNDLSTFCPERRPADKYGLPAGFVIMSEMFEAVSLVLEPRVLAVINKYPDLVEFIHVSDQYTGAKQVDDSAPVEAIRAKPTLCCCFNIPGRGRVSAVSNNSMDMMKPLLQLVLFMVDRMKRYRLSREARVKADRNRQRLQETLLKQSHQSRAEKAQAKRDEKRRQEKERILQEEDPDKQRRLEERTERREAKRRQPRMRQMRVKAL